MWATPGPTEATDVLLHHLGLARLVDEVIVAPSAADAARGEATVETVDQLLQLAETAAVAT